jgi:hypothetical protein
MPMSPNATSARQADDGSTGNKCFAVDRASPAVADRVEPGEPDSLVARALEILLHETAQWQSRHEDERHRPNGP